jgi:hypothetical protein
VDRTQLIELQRTARHGSFVGAIETGADFAQRLSVRTASRYGSLPVGPQLSSLFPTGGLERGHIYGCRGDAWLSVMYALIARATQEGSWVAVVNLEFMGMMSAAEHGVALQRVLCVDAGVEAEKWAHVVGACVDGVDIVVLYRPQCRPSDVRRLEARMKAHGTTVIVVGDPGPFSPAVVVSTQTTDWGFSTHMSQRSVHVVAHGRRMHQVQHCDIVFPYAERASAYM